MNTTPLYQEHLSLGARMVEFGGWLMPVQYEGIIREHEWTRSGVGVFDTCHMGQIAVTGPSAIAALQRVVTPDVAKMTPGQCRYGFMLNERGGVVDDLVTCCRASDDWLLVVNAGTHGKDVAWLRDRIAGAAELRDLSAERGKLDVQGPGSQVLLARVLGFPLDDLRFFHFKACEFEGREVLVSRTGYTGERGYEVYAGPDQIVALWRALLAAGAHPAGLGARDTLRLEAGLPLYGHELSEDISPVQAGLDRFIRKQTSFIGSEALARERAAGPEFRLTGFALEGRQAARDGCRLYAGNEDAGWVTSGSYAPTLGRAVGMAYVAEAARAKGVAWEVDNGRKRMAAQPVVLPFYRSEELR